jgi:hypothetical protein
MPPLNITFADGSTFKPGLVSEPAPAVGAPTTRTRLQIAQELDAAESKLKAGLEQLVGLRADVSRLEKELREYGVKKRGPRKGKE